MAIEFVDRVPTYPGRIKFTKEDGTVIYGVWERADSPTVVGTPLNAETLNAMQADNGLSQDLTLYVSTTGSDASGKGTQAAPYATFAKALSTVPKNLNGHIVYLHAANGTYAEELRITNFHGGWVYLAGGTYTVRRLMVEDANAIVSEANITVDGQGSTIYGVSATWNGALRITKNITIRNVTAGMLADFNGYLNASSTTVTINSAATAVMSQNGSRCVLSTVTGTGNTTGIAAYAGGLVTFSTNSLTTTGSKYVTDTGGKIYSGAQGEVPNW